MAEEIKTEITQVSESTEAAIKRNTAAVLPDNPTAAGMKADDIKSAFFKGITDGNFSVLAELKRVITEANGVLGTLAEGVKNANTLIDGRVEKIPPILPNHSYVYGVDGEGNTILHEATISNKRDCLVMRDELGGIIIQAPSKIGHAISLGHFNKKANNSLYSEVMEAVTKVRNLEHSASGNIYSTVKLRGVGSVIQVDDACPYGVLSRIGGKVAKITVGVPFDLSGATVFKNNSAYGECTVKGNSIIFRKGGTYGVQIPCVLPGGTAVTVDAKSVAFDTRDRISHYILLDSNGSTVSSQGVINTEVTVTEGKTAAYILLYKENKTNALYDDLEIRDLRVLLSDPAVGSVMQVVDEIGIPEDVRSLVGYGEDGAYIDLMERKFYNVGGETIDLSAYLPVESDVISLLPSALVEFTDASGNRVAVDYELSYKNKI